MSKVFLTPMNILKKVWSRSSVQSTISKEQQELVEVREEKCESYTVMNGTVSNRSKSRRHDASLALEIQVMELKVKMEKQKRVIEELRTEGDRREVRLAEVAREKQQLAIELKKERRESIELKKQLEDEREFYFQEKETYCQEMTECKKLKQSLTKTKGRHKITKQIMEYKRQLDNMRTEMQHTFEVNYNLSVRFMRMRCTKDNMQKCLKKEEERHNEAIKSFQSKIEAIKTDIEKITDKRFNLLISPSNKRYLHIIKQNGVLLHENLNLQCEVEHLQRKIERKKLARLLARQRRLENRQPSITVLRKKATTKLIYESPKSSNKKATVDETSPAKIVQKDSKSSNNNQNSSDVITIYERSKEDPKPLPKESTVVEVEQHLPPPSPPQQTYPCSRKASRTSCNTVASSDMCFTSPSSGGVGASSEITTTISGATATRTQSAPEIVQTVEYVRKPKKKK